MFYYFFYFLELQKEEEDQGPLCPLAPPSSNACQDTSHPYYDVARHGILQVTGNIIISIFIYLLQVQSSRALPTDIIAIFADHVSFHDKGQGFPGLVSMHHSDHEVLFSM